MVPKSLKHKWMGAVCDVNTDTEGRGGLGVGGGGQYLLVNTRGEQCMCI